MAVKELMFFAILLCCLLVMQQINQAIVGEYIHVNNQRRVLLLQIMDSSPRKCPKSERRQRRFWKRPGRTSLWWDNFLNGVMLEEEWREYFRMSRVNFFNLAGLLRPYIKRQDTVMRKPVTVETQVAVTLYHLSDEGRLRKVANASGLSRSCCSIIARRVSFAITKHLGPLYIPMTEESVKEKVSKFYDAFSVPQCLGAIDGTHRNKTTIAKLIRLHQ